MGKYDPLGDYLRAQATSEVSLTFQRIEEIVGFDLPSSSRFSAWWSNNPWNNVMTKVWLAAGYQTEQVNIADRKLVFRRVAANALSGMQEEEAVFKPAPPVAPPTKKVDRHPAIGALKGMFTIEPGYDIASSDPEEVAGWEAAIDRKADLIDAGLKKKP